MGVCGSHFCRIVLNPYAPRGSTYLSCPPLRSGSEETRLTHGTVDVKALWLMDHGDARMTAGGPGMPQPKISISAIQDVLRAVEEAPDCDETEVAKIEAMRRLVPAIKTMQAKGYGLAPIAKLLCDKGIAVTEVSLKQYMHRLGSRNVTETARVGKCDRLATGSLARQLRNSSRPLDVAASSPARSQPPHVDAAATVPPRSVPGTASVSLASQPPVPTPPATQVAASRSGFVVRPDRKNI